MRAATRSTKSATVAFTAALAIMVAGCGSGGAESSSSATQPPDVERTMVLYSGRAEELVAPLIERFEQATGIAVEVRYAGSGELATTLSQEGDLSPADVFWSQDPAFAGAVADLFQPLPSDILAKVPTKYSDSQGRWVGVTARNRVLVYNPDLVTELPSDVWALTGPEWRGKLGVAPTNGSFVAFVSAMVLTEGDDRTLAWLEGIAANEPVIFDGNAPIVSAVDAGDVSAGLVNHYYLLRLQDEQGGATAINHSFASGDPGALVMPSGAGILAGATNQSEAIEFVEFLLSADTQRYFLTEVFEYPLVDGVGTPEGQIPLSDLPDLEIDPSDLATVVDRATDLIAEAGLT